MNHLTESQQKVLDYVKLRISGGIPPSIREICSAVGLNSSSSVHFTLKNLAKRGVISWSAGHCRSIQVLPETSEACKKNEPFPPADAKQAQNLVPLIGRVTAGTPLLAAENIQDYISYPGTHPPAGTLFALRITDDSMTGAAILDGDIIIAALSQAAENGDIVVALIEDEAIVRRLCRENETLRLQPENRLYKPTVLTEAELLGKVRACVRSY